ncbi:galactose-1-phosphate uridylyltransferase [Mycolicibacterium canariasense]|nr:galactose-1-phosphate uridylyltransferase [Mycolicibacterium canariasense]MCV7212184.1 galactose-1-phosphate uridylyltransferase [Mycolicibacterium canariasense]ORU95305.1 galactose-1-phosphate uridylyltransferase [Mycolicibacterium canariasense]
MVGKTVTTLADGRRLIYFDELAADGRMRRTGGLTDTRNLEPMVADSHLRYDVLTGEWVTIAAQRMDRTFLPAADASPLAPTRAGSPATEIPAADYDVVVFENRFPALSEHAVPTASLVDGEPLWPQAPGRGSCEVVCFTSDPHASFAELGHRRARTVIEAWADRTAELSEIPGVQQVFCFENRGREIGVTLTHPHGQIYAYPFQPARTRALVEQARRHAAATGRNLMADVLAAEQHSGRRLLVAGEHWTAFVPAAARWPLEIQLIPHRDVPDFPALSGPEREELAAVYLNLLARVDRFFDGVAQTPYIAAWHQAPIGPDRAYARLHLQLFSLMRSPGRMKYLAGSESGMGAWISDTTPERIADRLREVA